MKKWAKVLIGILLLVVAGGGVLIVYLAGAFYYPRQIENAYQAGDCSKMLETNYQFEQMYDPALRVVPVPQEKIAECAIYLVAGQKWKQGSWQEACNIFKEYVDKYPQGIFLREAKERIPEALFNIAVEQSNEGEFTASIDTLSKVIIEYAGTTAAGQAAEQMPENYLAWAAALEKDGDYPRADEVLISFSVYAQGTNNPALVDKATRARANLYLQQARRLLDQKEFEQAKKMAELSVALAPSSTDDTHPASQARAIMPQIYIAWGDDTSAKGDIKRAQELYEKALTLVGPDERAQIEERIFRGKLSVVDVARQNEDFRGALGLVDELQKSPLGDNFKPEIEQKRADVMQAFSVSTGEQAKQAMKDTAKGLCAGKKPAFDIFGKDSISKMIVRGIPDEALDKFPAELTASTPAELHYVICIEEIRDVIQTVSASVFRKYPYVYEYIGWKTLYRTQITWKVKIYHAEDAKLVITEVIKGPPPPPFWFTVQSMRGNLFIYVDAATQKDPEPIEGERPPIEEFVAWLKSVIK